MHFMKARRLPWEKTLDKGHSGDHHAAENPMDKKAWRWGRNRRVWNKIFHLKKKKRHEEDKQPQQQRWFRSRTSLLKALNAWLRIYFTVIKSHRILAGCFWYNSLADWWRDASRDQLEAVVIRRQEVRRLWIRIEGKVDIAVSKKQPI